MKVKLYVSVTIEALNEMAAISELANLLNMKQSTDIIDTHLDTVERLPECSDVEVEANRK